MAQKIINTKIREAYDTEANWIKHNPVLLAGQLAFSSDKYGKYKVGNGTSTWSQLQYVTLNWGDIGGKPSFAPTTHNHTISQITDIGNASVKYATTAGSANAVVWGNVSGKPSSMKNPYALTLTSSNRSKSIQYDGSSAQTFMLTSDLLYGVSDDAIAHVTENSNKNTRYVKLLDVTCDTSWRRINQQFIVALRHASFLLNIHIASTENMKFSQYDISYIPISSNNNIEITRFLAGIVHVDSLKDRFELWYKQDQWTSSASVIPIGRSAETVSLYLKGYDTGTTGNITTKPVFAINIPIKNNMPALYNSTGNATDGTMTQQAITKALKEHNHTVGQITGLTPSAIGAAKYWHTHNILTVPDTRDKNPAPNNAEFQKQAVSFDFKRSNAIGSPIPDAGEYLGLMSFAPWSDDSGGNGYQMVFGYSNANTTAPKLAIRTANLGASAWNQWYKIYTSADKPTLSELGAAPASHTHNYAPTSHTHTIANITNIAEASVKKAISSDVTSAIKDSNNGRSINISYQDQEVSTASWFPVWVGNNKIGTINPTNVRNVIKASPIDHTHSHVPNADTANLANYIKDKSDNRPIGISHLLETTTATRFPVWNSDNTLVTMTATNFRKSISAAPDNHNHDTIYASNSHSHSSIHDCNSGSSIGISSTLGVTATTVGKYDIVVTNTSVYGNKFVAMDKGSLVDTIANDVNGRITINAISNAQIDSLAKL